MEDNSSTQTVPAGTVRRSKPAKVNYPRCEQVLAMFERGHTFARGEYSCWGIGGKQKVAVGLSGENKYYIQHEWIVPEGLDDDPGSVTGGLFPGQCSVGYRILANTADALSRAVRWRRDFLRADVS